MLKHQEDPEISPPISAPQARVTPAELSEALAAIESRKQAEASRLAGTIPIAQAVSELNLDSSPEEIWAEVQTSRAKTQAEQAQAAAAEAARQDRERQQRAAQAASVPQFVAPRPRSRPRRGIRIFLPLLGIWTVFHFGIIPNIFSHHKAVLPGQTAPLSQISDGTEAYASSAALMQLSEGKPLTSILVDKNQGDNTWPLLKRGGHVYLRGYILQTPSLKTVAGDPLNVYNDDNSGELSHKGTSAITLRVDGVPLQKSNGNDDFSEVTVPQFQPDPLTTLTPWR